MLYHFIEVISNLHNFFATFTYKIFDNRTAVKDSEEVNGESKMPNSMIGYIVQALA